MRQDYKTHPSEQKKKAVEEFTDLLKKYDIIGVVNLKDLPCQQLNNMRKKLREQGVTIKMAKSNVLKLAMDNIKGSKKGMEDLEEYLKGMPALLFTKENPFTVFKTIKKSKSKAAAKAGQVLPDDAMVSAGPTSFTPGPIISELSSYGIKTKVNNGKLDIQEDTVIAKKGEEVDAKLASMLMKLGIEPMEIGLDLVAVYEDGTVFTKDVLDIDEEQYRSDFDNAARWAFNLSVEATYPNKDNASVLITKAFSDAKGLAEETSILCNATIENMIIRSENTAQGLKASLGV